MSEEIQNARVVVPQAMIIALCVGGCSGFATLIGVLFSLGDPDSVLNSEYEYPFAQLFLQATKSRAGSAIMAMIIIVLQVVAVIGLLAAASRMLWAFARDKGVPLWKHISRVSKHCSKQAQY